jgi:predicted ferric reductase
MPMSMMTATRAVPTATPWSRLRRRRAWARSAALAFAAGTLAALVVLWLADGGIAAVHTPGGAALTFGRLTGLIAAQLLLLQVLLMARIPPLERAWGQGALTRVHRLVGMTSFTLMLAHIVLIVVGYTQAGRLSLWGQIGDLVTNYPAMLLAVAGTVALTAVMVTSLRAARRRLRYESWHLIHLYAYLGVGLVLPHQLWTGADFLASPGMTIFWWLMWVAAAGAIAVFRIALPLGRSLLHQMVVESVIPEGPHAQSVIVLGRNMSWLRPLPGQYFQWRFLTGPGWTRAHPYSVSAMPDEHRLRITMDVGGDEGGRLARLRPGTRVLIEGPYGSLTADRRVHRDVLLLAAGLGITPMRGLAEHIAAEGARTGRPRPSVIMLHRISHPRETLFAAEWQALAIRHGVDARALMGPRGAADSWLPAAVGDPARYLRATVPGLADRDVYLCGPRDWMRKARDTVLALGVPRRAIHQESFGV